MSSRLHGPLLALLAVAVFATPAYAAWNAGGDGDASSKARSLSTVGAPTASVSNRSVTVSWNAPGGGAPPDGYVVTRYDLSDQAQTIGTACSGTIAATSCTESGVPPGGWKYAVTAVRGNWSGAESTKSSTVSVTAPALTISSPTVNSFPTNLSGQITNFIPGQNVTFRLDNPSSGPILSGSITPVSVPANGTAAVSVTIPAGTSNGAYTVYAIGNAGDQASAPITVNAPKVTGSVIGKSAGGRTGRIRQGGTYRIYANVSGSGGPPAGLASLTADVSTVTTGQTSVAMSFGSYTAGGQSYNYRSAILTANGVLSEGTRAYTTRLTDSGGTVTIDNFSVIVDNTRPTGTDVQTTNVSGGTAGRAELGDTITRTYSEQMEEISVLAGWSGAATNVVVRLRNGGGDRVEIWNAANTVQLPLGSVNLARTDYVTVNRTFGATGTPSTMVMSGNSVTVTLGTASGAVGTAAAASAMVWTPSTTATDVAGNAAQNTNATETGPSDLNF